VVVQPSFYAADNTCTLAAVERSKGRARAVVVVDEQVSPRELADMHARGARGVRLQMVAKGGLTLDVDVDGGLGEGRRAEAHARGAA
jgi:predicted TIM-barrel fold metal-dependent hydrolase